MSRKKINVLLLCIAVLGILLQRGCGKKENETAIFQTRDVSQFDGPYILTKVNDDGAIVIKKNDKEYIFEFLGLPKGEWLAKQLRDFLDKSIGYLWIEYDQNKFSPSGNLQGYAYYEWQRVHDAKSQALLSTSYRMINGYLVWGDSSEVVNDGQTHKHLELLIEEAIKSYKKEIEWQKRGVEPSKGSVFVGRSIKDLETKLAEYEKMLADYRARKKSSD